MRTQNATITFQVDLSTPGGNNNSPSSNSNFEVQNRSCFIPGLSSADNLVRKHGDIFTLQGRDAIYLLNLINKRLMQPVKVLHISDVFTYDVIGDNGVFVDGYSICDVANGGIIINEFGDGGGLWDGLTNYENVIYNEFGYDGSLLDGTALSTNNFIPMFDGTFFLEKQNPSDLPSGNSARSMFAWVRVPDYTTAQAMFGYGGEEDAEH